MRTITKTVFAGLVAALLAAAAVQAADYYVSISNVLGHAAPYTNWATAATNIQFAVDEASAEDTIWVGPGRYTVPTNAVFSYSATNVVYLDTPLTLRSTAGAAETFIDGEGSNRAIAVNYSGHVRFTFDGFTITNGYALEGGGAHLATHNYTCEFFNCVFADNTASNAGGAIRGYATSTFHYKTLSISNTVFRDNRCLDGSGGAIYGLWTHLQIDDCLFESNRVDATTYHSGGAISIDRGEHRIENTIFRDNRASSSGSANTGGGAIGLDRGTLLMRNCLVTENHGRYAGGIHVKINGASVELDNCTFVTNGSSGIYFRNKTPYLHAYNSIFYDNSGNDIQVNYTDVARVLDIRHCAYETALLSTNTDDTVILANNIVTNSLDFVDPANEDFHLPLISPCVNTGTNRAWHAGAVDLDGNRRVDGSFNKVDMGCYEYLYQGTAIMIR